MTEAPWLAGTPPERMLRFLHTHASARKRRLFLCGFCRQIWPRLHDERSRRSVERAEDFADGKVAEAELLQVAGEAVEACRALRGGQSVPDAVEAAWTAARASSLTSYLVPAGSLPGRHLQTQVFADLYGHPFRSHLISPTCRSWNHGVLHDLAHTIYDEQNYSLMPLLADALEDAGCDNAEVVNHCRRPGEHVRGCWVVDLLLGMS